MATFVITASVYVDGCDNEEDAARAVDWHNTRHLQEHTPIQIRLPDSDSGHKWEPVTE